jgi:hypothetical protein
MTAVVDIKIKRAKRTLRNPPLGPSTGSAGRFFDKMVRDIETDLGGRRQLSRIEGELIRAFAGAATTLQYLNVQVALGETGELDLSGYATIASTMLRIGARLGLQRRQKDVTTLSDLICADQEVERQRLVREQQDVDEGVEP